MKDSSELIRFDESRVDSQNKPVRTVNPQLYTNSTVLFDNYEDLMLANSGDYDGITYGTDRLPTQRAFEEALNSFENGHLTRAFQSGISAITHTLLTFTGSGDHIHPIRH
jgi:cystathionine beta-lyase